MWRDYQKKIEAKSTLKLSCSYFALDEMIHQTGVAKVPTPFLFTTYFLRVARKATHAIIRRTEVLR